MGTIFSYLTLWWDAKYQYGVCGAGGDIWGLFRGANHTNTNSNGLLQSQKQRLIPWGALGVRWQASGCGGNCVDCVVARDWEDYCLILGTSGSKLDSKCPRGGRYSYLGRCTSNTIMWLDLYNNAAHMCCKVDWPAYEALYGTCYCGIWVAPRGVPVICVIWGQFDL